MWSPATRTLGFWVRVGWARCAASATTTCVRYAASGRRRAVRDTAWEKAKFGARDALWTWGPTLLQYNPPALFYQGVAGAAEAGVKAVKEPLLAVARFGKYLITGAAVTGAAALLLFVHNRSKAPVRERARSMSASQTGLRAGRCALRLHAIGTAAPADGSAAGTSICPNAHLRARGARRRCAAPSASTSSPRGGPTPENFGDSREVRPWANS